MAKKMFIPILLMCITLLGYFLFGWLCGFPGERKKVALSVNEYIKKYDIYDAELLIGFAPDGMNSARVHSNVIPFEFDVSFGRDDYTVFGDTYAESLVEYNLESLIMESIQSPYVQKVIVVSYYRFSKDERDEIIEKVNADPNVIFNIPDIEYGCILSVTNTAEEELFKISEEIMTNFNPAHVSFYDVDGNEIIDYPN